MVINNNLQIYDTQFQEKYAATYQHIDVVGYWVLRSL